MGLFTKRKKAYTSPTGEFYNLYADMLKQPHLLIAGATGSGKSVVENGIIYTALYKHPGHEENKVTFIFIDPKRVELNIYKNLPHCLCYASEPEDRINALQFAMKLCEDRFKSMQRNDQRKYPGGDCYVFIDEFADLMTTQKKDCMPIIQRLAQIGRAAKIHIILCTQTPINKVLPTEIKCNFDARVGLRTRSAQDSRNILGFAGLENLPQYGQGIYYTPKEQNLYEIPFYTDDELLNRVKWWTDQL